MRNPNIVQNIIKADLAVRPANRSASQPLLSPELDSIAEKIFTHPNGWSDGIYRTPLLWISDYLKNNGIAPENIRAGHLTYLGLNSVRLGLPLSLILTTEDLPVAQQLLDVCKRIAPENSFCEVQKLKAEELYSGQEFFRDKVIICHDVSASKKAIPDLLTITAQGYAMRQVPFRSRFGSGMHKVTAKHPKAFIGIETTDKNNPFIYM